MYILECFYCNFEIRVLAFISQVVKLVIYDELCNRTFETSVRSQYINIFRNVQDYDSRTNHLKYRIRDFPILIELVTGTVVNK